LANISEFKAALVGGGARANQFKVELNMPFFVGGAKSASKAITFLCKAASLPESRIGDIPLMYRGRPVHVAGEREFSNWQITAYNDTDFAIRNAFEQWQDVVANYSTTAGKTTPVDYQVDSTVYQLDRNGAVLKSYKFYDMWPLNVGQIELSYEANQQIEEFQVELVYNYFVPSNL